MASSIREAAAKGLLRRHDNLCNECISVNTQTCLDDLKECNPWLLEKKLVVKPDVLLKRRGKSGLVRINVSWEEAKLLLQTKLGTEQKVGELTGILSHFIVEPYFEHDEGSEEMYVAIRTLREGDEILFSMRGGVDVGEVEQHTKSLVIPVLLEDGEEHSIDFHSLVADVKNEEMKVILIDFLKRLYAQFCRLHFSFLEINPLGYDAQKKQMVVMDCTAKLDHTADFLCDSLWGAIEFPSPFGRAFTAAEQHVRDLDSKTGASLKLTVLNPLGRIWMMIAGGGASVIYADTVCDLGYAHELANYGEYSGAPSEVTTYEYAKTILGLVTAPDTHRPEGKILLIGGGIANFTSVADTFRGIRRAIFEYQNALRDSKVRIYVRRGGPNYEDGLKMMREIGKQLNLPIKVYGPETYMTAIIQIAMEEDLKSKEYENNNEAKSSEKAATGDEGGGWRQSDGNSSISLPEDLETVNNKSCIVNGINSSNKCAGKYAFIPTRQESWKEMRMEDIDMDENFANRVLSIVNETHKKSSKLENSRCTDLFKKTTRCVVWGLQTRAVQEMLDFDHVCGREKPSVAAIVYEFSVSHLRPFYFGTEEIFIPVCQTLQEAVQKCSDVHTLINFASMRSAAAVTSLALNSFPQIKTIAIIAEGVPERKARELIVAARKKGVTLIGPATVGGMKPGCFRIGNTGGSLENIMNAKLYRPGSVAFVTKSGGMLNEINNILSVVTDGTYEGVAIGGDRFPGTTMLDHLIRYEEDPNIKILVLLGEVGGAIEYEVVDAMKKKMIKKPVIAWCVGTCAPLFSTEVAFGHAGAWAGGAAEHSAAKNEALRNAGCFVPQSFQYFGSLIKEVYEKLLERGVVKTFIEPEAPRVPMDYAWAKKLGLVRKPKGFVSSISDDRGEELVYAGWKISCVMQSMMGVGGVISLLWFKRPLPDYAYRYLESVLMLTADHGPAVCGAHNTIVTARAGKDLISALISGLCTIGDRFGGACDQAAQQFLRAYQNNLSPECFVKDMKAKNQLIMGIGHKMKSVNNPDMRVTLLKDFCKQHFPKTSLIEFAEAVEKITTKKKDTLILNVDGLIGVSMCDLLYGCGAFSESEAKDYIENGCINGLFVLGRSIGFIGHYLDQRRLKQGLYRHDVDDISYVLPDLGRE